MRTELVTRDLKLGNFNLCPLLPERWEGLMTQLRIHLNP